MDQPQIWWTDIEIFTLAHSLQTCAFIYSTDVLIDNIHEIKPIDFYKLHGISCFNTAPIYAIFRCTT